MQEGNHTFKVFEKDPGRRPRSVKYSVGLAAIDKEPKPSALS
jgi:hypothetical protein